MYLWKNIILGCRCLYFSRRLYHVLAAYPCPCPHLHIYVHMSVSILPVQVYVVWPCPCCVSMSMLHIHVLVPSACLCPSCIFMSMIHVPLHVHAVYLHAYPYVHSYIYVYVYVYVHVYIYMYKCRNVGLSSTQSVQYRNVENQRCWNRSNTNLSRHSLAFFGPVQNLNFGCRYAYAGVSFLNADAQLGTQWVSRIHYKTAQQ